MKSPTGAGSSLSRFLHARTLTRLQITIAPLLFGSGLPAITLPQIEDLASALPLSWRTFATAHAPAIVLSGALVVTVGPTAVLLRAVGASSVVILGCGVIVATAVTVLMIRLAPRVRFNLFANVIADTLDLVPVRAAAFAALLCGPAYAQFPEVMT